MYDQIGGEPFFERLVGFFYDAVERDEVLRAMYPDDLSEAKHHLLMFLVQYWGGPRTYSEERGHPRLRMRHAPFRINRAARDGWLVAMGSALEAVRSELSDEQFAEMNDYFTSVAHQLRNV
ncbi:MAG: globin [Acidimicrobiaceae bacterium]|nr:globin [Acidimicrobiaceae bacterium]